MLEITPKTKIAEVIEAYPQLKDRIIALAPPFKKLNNPFLLKTIARVTSLSQAAKVGDIPLVEFVNALRKEVGQDPLNMENIEHSSAEPPFWFKTGAIVKTIDARPMLEQGEHPVGLVLEEIQNIGEGQILQVITPFLPAPMIDKVVAKNFNTWTQQKGAEEFRNYFSPRP